MRYSRLRFPIILAGCAVIVGGLASAQTTQPASQPQLPASLPADQVEARAAIPYAQAGGETLLLDMARPKVGSGPWPAVVCIHGGGWVAGNRASMQPFIRYLAAYGFVAVSPSYRLAPKHPFPAAVADVRQCVRWLRLHAAEYGIDPARIGAVGLSAGGHLVCMLGVTADDDRFGPDDEPLGGQSCRVQAVVNYFGPGDLAASDWSAKAVRQYLIPFLGGTSAERPDEYRKASPITYVSRDDAPVLTFHGDQDVLVPPTQARTLHARLDAAGVKNRLVMLGGQGHGWGEPHATQTMRQMVAFFREQLRPAATTQPATTRTTE